MSVFVVQGGLFENEATRKLANGVATLACATLTLYIISTINTLAAPETRALLSGDEWIGETGYGVSPVVAVVGNAVLNIFIFALIMCCGIVGAKQQNNGLLLAFCFCNGFCGICSLCGVIALAAGAGLGVYSCAVVAEFFNPASCYISIVFLVILMLCMFANTYFSFALYQKSQTIVVAHVQQPPVPMGYAQQAPVQMAYAQQAPGQMIPVAQPAGDNILGEQKLG